MSHCPGCSGISYDDQIDGEPAIGPNSPPCPGCGHEAEIVALRNMVRELILELILHCPDALHKEQLAEFDAMRGEMP